MERYSFDKKMTSRTDRELRKLAAHNKPGLSEMAAVPARAHNMVPVVGKTAGESTCPKAPSDKLLEKAMSKAMAPAQQSSSVMPKGSPAKLEASAFQEPGEGSKRSAAVLSSPVVDKKRANKTEGMDTDEEMQHLNLLKMSLSPQKAAESEKASLPSSREVTLSDVLVELKSLRETVTTKGDLAELKEELSTELLSFVETRVRPLEQKLEKLTEENEELKRRVAQREEKKETEVDPAPKRVMFQGFKNETSATARLEAMKDFCARFPAPTAVVFGNDHKGPWNDRSLKNSGYAEFADKDAALGFLKVATKEVQVEGAKVTVKKALTKAARTRNWALGAACDLLKKAKENKGKVVELVWKDRLVKVGDEVAFKQEKGDTKGEFTENFFEYFLP